MKPQHLITVLCIALLQCGTARGEDLNPVVGKAGDFVLRETDVERLLGSQPPEVQKAVQDNAGQRKEFVRQFLLMKSVASKARKDGFDKKPEVKELLSNLMDQYLAREYLIRVVAAGATVSEDELKAYYREHQKEFLFPESVRARHIFIAAPPESSPNDREKARAKAERILEQAKKGEDFARLAREHSEDSDTAAKGGEVGLLSPGKTNSPEFEKAVFALKAGETTLAETAFGYHIIKADERTERRTATFDEARDYIRDTLEEQNKRKTTEQFLERISRETGLEVAGEKQ